jgi:transposase InsO family protein
MADTTRVSIEPLDVNNYATWAVRMKMLLMHKELWAAVADPGSLEAAERSKLNKALSLILLNVKDHHLLTLESCQTPSEAWDALKAVYQASNTARQMQLRKELNSLSKQATETIALYAGRVRGLWSDLSSAGVTVTEQDVAMAMLAGLPAEYQTVVEVLEGSVAQLSFAAVMPRLLVAEQRVLSRLSAESQAFAARTVGKSGGQGRDMQRIVCFNCGQRGHYQRDCKQPRKGLQGGVAMTAGTSLVYGWVLDSGASQHMTCGESCLIDRVELAAPVSVVLGDGRSCLACVSGKVQLTRDVQLHDVLLVPELKTNLFSVKHAAARGMQVLFSGSSATISAHGHAYLRAVADASGLYYLQVSDGDGGACAAVARVPESAELWHARFGHLGYDGLARLAAGGMVSGMHVGRDAFEAAGKHVCDTCVLGKQTKLPFHASSSQCTGVLQLVHMDVCGPMPVPSLGGSMYVATFLDDYSKLSVVRPVAAKSDVGAVVKEVIASLENITGATVRAVRSDRGGEYMSGMLGAFFRERGIAHQLSAPYTPQQNGAAERLNRTLLDKVRSMLIESDLPHALWAECFVTANYVRNRSPVHGQQVTPLEAFLGRKPDVSHLRVFGCRAFLYVDKKHRRKLDAVSQAGVLVGYESGDHAYRVYMPDTGKVEVSKHVVFDEKARGMKRCAGSGFLQDVDDAEVVDENGDHGDENVHAGDAVDEPMHDGGSGVSAAGAAGAAGAASNDGGENQAGNGSAAGHSSGDDAEMSDGRYPKRQHRQPQPWWVSKKQRVNIAFACMGAADMTAEPTSFAEAMQSVDAELWKGAMDEEMRSLHANGTWTLERVPEGVRPVPVKWVFKVKHTAAGGVERHKARLVAKGYAQQEGIDYNEVFAPVGKHTTLRGLLAVVSVEDMELHQLDVKTAFLNGDLEEDIWMQQPPGYEELGEGYACHLRKALYGLKQAPRAWHTRLKHELEQFGFVVSDADAGLYMMEQGGEVVYVLVYVDDMLLASRSMLLIDEVKRRLQGVFDIHDLGEATMFLGMEISRDRSSKELKLTQHRAAVNLASKYGLHDANGRCVPVSVGTQLSGEGAVLDTSVYGYSELVGSLLYLSVCTRPDLAQAVGALARYMSRPTVEHWRVAKGVLRYVAGTANCGIIFGRVDDDGEAVVGFCDADFAGDVDTRRSTTGYVYLLHGGAISWSSRLQSTVAVSTVEAEYMSAAAAVKEALWLSVLLTELGVSVRPMRVHCDNQGALKLLKHPIASQRSKHIDVLYHFAREKVMKGDVEFVYCATENMVADILTKPLSKNKFEMCRAAMGVVSA